MNTTSSTELRIADWWLIAALADGTLTMALNCQAYSERSRACSDVTGRYAMDWNRVEGNWKQIKGKVKEKWGILPTTIWIRSPAVAISSREKFRSVMAWRKIKSEKMSTIG